VTAPADHSATAVILKPWRDPVVERCGFPVNSPYVEVAWLPSLGPSTTWALRRLGLLVTARPDGVEVDLRELAMDLGLGQGTARNSMVVRTLRRLELFGMARWPGELAVRTVVPPLPARLVERLSPRATAAHRQLLRLRHMACDRPPRRAAGLSR
jgi:hypothetical protein